jgi:hypothetical protein
MTDYDESVQIRKKLKSLLSKFAPSRALGPAALPTDLLRNPNLADHLFKVITTRIKEFEASLDDDFELAIILPSFGNVIQLNLTDVGYSNPNTLVFNGVVNGQKATVIQHMSMFNLLLLGVPKQDLAKPRWRIGFFMEQETVI